MADTNCTEESKNPLINPPKLLDDSQLKIKADLNTVIRQSSAVSLFKKDGIPLSKLLNFNCLARPGMAEVKQPSPLATKLRLGVNYKDGACFVNLGCKF